MATKVSASLPYLAYLHYRVFDVRELVFVRQLMAPSKSVEIDIRKQEKKRALGVLLILS